MDPAADTAAAPPQPPAAPTLLDPDEITRRLAQQLPSWRYQDRQLLRDYRTSGWPATLMVANAIAQLAEAAWHHPELLLGYAQVQVRLSTHDAGGVTGRDLALAERIEQVLLWPAEAGSLLAAAPDAKRLIVG